MMEPVGFADPVDVAGHCQSSVQLRRRTHCRAHPRERGTDGYADNRYYDLYSGQFLSVDPLVGVTNQPYVYAADDPINGSDPNGLCGAEDEPADAGGPSSAPPDLENLSSKIEGQMQQRGWTPQQIQEAFDNGEQVNAINKATGGSATRYINPTTGQSVVIGNTTGQVIHVGGPGFLYGLASGDVS